ncbi:hypothetical protein H8356DRAFT_39994 [Neocallimastix lanati (nom. inval.)]|jgi:hypothetical protein|uniref:Uncharacterized protein n=1 Tax=Neocallimastix californiae TaxID=1754190 RepID=A0A1Y2ASN4_9FUNG|nr:hypothetical protein H8356DRAFT_39994 [Neocallimastix sp. JGI-2020a]ORY25583.1 hypothetical protein LY90DRAFT_706280 [Neocallimastix californiae]|eukprot:ORY25583.1 hypothetical protein LY90DRAFT_706280 [Neocallimastix californiae]
MTICLYKEPIETPISNASYKDILSKNNSSDKNLIEQEEKSIPENNSHGYKTEHQGNLRKEHKPLKRKLSMHFKRDLIHMMNINKKESTLQVQSDIPKMDNDKIDMIINECTYLYNINRNNTVNKM